MIEDEPLYSIPMSASLRLTISLLEGFVSISCFAMVRDSAYAQRLGRQNPPRLSSDHPDFQSYRALIERDQQVYIRRLMPAALEAFQQALGL